MLLSLRLNASSVPKTLPYTMMLEEQTKQKGILFLISSGPSPFASIWLVEVLLVVVCSNANAE